MICINISGIRLNIRDVWLDLYGRCIEGTVDRSDSTQRRTLFIKFHHGLSDALTCGGLPQSHNQKVNVRRITSVT